jgi:hypothetical protein
MFAAVTMLIEPDKQHISAAITVHYFLYFGVPFCIFYALMQIFVVDRLALVAGKTDPIAEAPTVMTSSFIKTPETSTVPHENLESEVPLS